MKNIYKGPGLVWLTLLLVTGFLLTSCSLFAYPKVRSAQILENSKASEKKLTLLVYMAADNDLEYHALQNLKAMEKADVSNMNILALLDRSEDYDETNDNWTDTRLFEIRHDPTNSSSIASKRLNCPELGLSDTSQTELDMGNYNVLKTFISYAKNNYPAQNYALILWGHGSGWRCSNLEQEVGRAVAIDDKSHSFISVKELGLALETQDFCVIGFDTCFGSIFENLYELKDKTRYLVASPGITPAAGWDYKSLLQALDSSDFSAEIIAEKMKASGPQKITITKSSDLNSIMQGVETFSQALADCIDSQTSRRAVLDLLMTAKNYSYTQYPCDMYLDLFSTAQLFVDSADSHLQTAAQELSSLTTSLEIGIHFIPKAGENLLASSHSYHYIKNPNDSSQCSFIKDSIWWVPTINGNSGSLLDKLFYTSFQEM